MFKAIPAKKKVPKVKLSYDDTSDIKVSMKITI